MSNNPYSGGKLPPPGQNIEMQNKQTPQNKAPVQAKSDDLFGGPPVGNANIDIPRGPPKATSNEQLNNSNDPFENKFVDRSR